MINQQKRYKAAGYAIFAVALGTLLCRLVFNSISLSALNLSAAEQDLIHDSLFTLIVQVVFCFLVPMFIYRRFQKIPYKQIFAESNFKKPKPWLIPASVLLGAGALCVTLTVSSIWRLIIVGFGYIYPTSSSAMPATFNAGYLIAALLFTAVLPGFCEEFAIRGTFLTAVKNSWGGELFIAIMALSFGLFHQSIAQVFYTALFGGFLAFLVIKTGSIIPGMIIHFTNNALATLMDYAGEYHWGGGMMDKFYDFLNSLGLGGLLLIAVVGIALLAPLTYLIIAQSRKDKTPAPVPTFKPSLHDSAFFIGAICLTVITTVLSFLFRF